MSLLQNRLVKKAGKLYRKRKNPGKMKITNTKAKKKKKGRGGEEGDDKPKSSTNRVSPCSKEKAAFVACFIF